MRHLSRSILFAMLCASLSLVLTAASVSAGSAVTVRYVDDDGQGSTTGCDGVLPIPSSIQAAVDVSSAGNFIFVCPGIYVGDVTTSVPNLTIAGVSAWTATVKPATDHTSNTPLISVLDTAGTKIKWLKLVAPTEGTCQPVSAMIDVSGSVDTTIRANHIGIEGTQGLGGCAYDTGIRVESSTNGGSDRTRVLWNRATDFLNRGIDLRNSPSVLVRGNTLSYFHAAYNTVSVSGAGITNNGNAAGVTILHNVIRGLPSGGHSTPQLSYGITAALTPATIKGNRIHHADTAIYLVNVTGASVLDNKARVGLTLGLVISGTHTTDFGGNTIYGSDSSAFFSSTTSGNTIHDNDFNGSSDPDCTDESAGPANTWTNNAGTSSPAGICTP